MRWLSRCLSEDDRGGVGWCYDIIMCLRKYQHTGFITGVGRIIRRGGDGMDLCGRFCIRAHIGSMSYLATFLALDYAYVAGRGGRRGGLFGFIIITFGGTPLGGISLGKDKGLFFLLDGRHVMLLLLASGSADGGVRATIK